jgi:regulatory protein
MRDCGGRDVSDHDSAAGMLERWALDYLGHYASSEENLRRVLRRRLARHLPEGAAEAAALIEPLLDRYRNSGLLDDAAYAAQRAQSLHERGESLHRIRARLAAKGVAPETAAAALNGLSAGGADPELRAACVFARRRRLGPYRRGAADPQRDLGAFARAGFSREATAAVLACPDVAAVEQLATDKSD